MEGNRAGPADLPCPSHLESRHAARLLRQVRQRHVDPFVDDGLADDADAQPGRARQEALQLIERETELRQIAEQHPVVGQQRVRLRGFRRGEQEVRQLGRRERLAVREVNPPAVLFDERFFSKDVGGLVEHQVGVLGPFHVHIGPKPLDRSHGGRLVDHRDVVHDFERGELSRAVLLAEGDRPLLRDVTVGGDGHHEDVAQGPRVLEVNQVPDVHEIEGAMAQHDRLVGMLRAQSGQPLE